MPAAKTSHNLPSQTTSFVGRARQIEEVLHLLGSARLLTLTGPGGAGKTRLALEVAARALGAYRDGVWLIELASLSDPSLVPNTIATVLRVPETAGETVAQSLLRALRDRETLLILDNCEHLVSACAHLSREWLAACPSLRILATTRERLSVPGELAYPVPPLSLPEEGAFAAPDRLMRSDAVRLFAERAAFASPGFAVTTETAAAVAYVCRRLDGMPLAIELAAARIRVLSAGEIAARLNDRFTLFANGARTGLSRHQTLRAVIDWSYDLLDARERTLLARISVFAGGFELDTVEAVCGGDAIASGEIVDVLGRLVDKSLVLAETHGGEARYRLQDSMRQYARERLLDSGEQTAVLARHRDWCLALAERAEPELQGPAQAEWLRRLTIEHDNLREALAFALEGGSGDAAVRLAASLWWFWHVRGHLSEGRAWLSRALAGEAGAKSAVRPRALYGQGFLAWRQGFFEQATALGEESLALSRERGDRLGMASAFSLLEHVARSQGDAARAVALAGQSLEMFRELDDTWGTATALAALGNAARLAGEHMRARDALEESLALFRGLNDVSGLAAALHFLGLVARDLGDYARAESAATEGLRISQEQGDQSRRAFALHLLGLIARDQGDYARAERQFEESLTLFREMGDTWGVTTGFVSLAATALLSGDAARAAAMFCESLTARRDLGDLPGIAECLEGLAGVAAVEGDATRAARLLGATRRLREAIGAPPPLARTEGTRDRTVETLQHRLGKRAFAAAVTVGRQLSTRQAIDEALALSVPGVEASDSGAPGEARLGAGRPASRAARTPASDRGGPGGILTAREQEVAALIAEGRSNREIAAALVITLGTAANHVQHILNKLGLHSRAQVAAWVVAHGVRRQSKTPDPAVPKDV